MLLLYINGWHTWIDKEHLCCYCINSWHTWIDRRSRRVRLRPLPSQLVLRGLPRPLRPLRPLLAIPTALELRSVLEDVNGRGLAVPT